MTRILVAGATGLLGSTFLRAAHGEHEILGVARSSRLGLPGVRFETLDLTGPGAAEGLVAEFKPDWIVNAAACTDLDRCERDPELAFRVNRDMAESIAAAGDRNGARMVHLSTDAVFDGNDGPYREADPTGPLSVYALSKLAGEHAVLQAHPQAIVVRTNFIGWNVQPKRSLAEWFMDCLDRRQVCPGFTDVFFNPIYVLDLAACLLDLIEIGFSGLLHIAGATCLSKYEFGCRLAEAFDRDAALIEPALLEQANLLAPRAQRLCLAVERAEQVLGRKMPTINTSIETFRSDRNKVKALAKQFEASKPLSDDLG